MTSARISPVWGTILLTITIFSLSLPACAKYSGGTGEPNDPYQIAMAADLIALGETPEDYNKHFILTADIDLDPNLPGRKVFDRAVIAPTRETPFTGIFDGSDHTISHLMIKGGGYVGLFGMLESGGEVKDLGVIDVNVTTSHSDYVGGLVAWNEMGKITTCYSTGKVSGTGRSVGGLVGRNEHGTLTQCYSTSAASGHGDYYGGVGGLVGYNWVGTLRQCYSSGSVNGDRWVGGLVGKNEATITECYSTSAVSGGSFLGGLVGDNQGTVIQCYSTGAVNGGSSIGGLVGSVRPAGVIHSVWDVETSRLPGSTGGVGLTTIEMMDPEMLGLNGFANDPNWVLDAGQDYPRLAWEGTPGQIIPEPNIDWLEGRGTAEDPYRIDAAEQLIFLGRASALCDRHFVLSADIDLDPKLPDGHVFANALIPIFTGVFDGNSHTISHLAIAGVSYLGLFGVLTSGAEAKDLGVVDVNVVGSGSCVGGLVGGSGGSLVGGSGGSVTRCYSSGVVSGDSNVGGLVGSNGDSHVTTCYSTAAVTGNEYVGGLIGVHYTYDNEVGSVTRCYSTGSVSGNSYVGGLIGGNGFCEEGLRYGVPVEECYSTGAVSGTSFVGGLVGYATHSNVTTSFWDIQTSGQATSDGGTGKTTAEMRDPTTFTAARWDFVAEIANGTHEVWQMPEGGGYPVLAIFNGYTPPELQGLGTPENPYLISDASELGATYYYGPEAHYRLAADVDLAGIRWTVAVIPSLGGTFDGNGHTISHLTIETRETSSWSISGRGAGLFGQLVSEAEVRDLGVTVVNIIGSDDIVGALVGSNSPGGNVTRCYSTGSISRPSGVGGLVGYNGGSVTASYSTASFSGAYWIGGLVSVNSGSISQCYSTGSISGGTCKVGGGLVGLNRGSISQCYSTGAVSGNYYVSGLVGSNLGSIMSSFWDMETSKQNTSDGGTGKTTEEMQTEKTFLEAGWDFVDETANGTDDIWWILEGHDYPRLWWENEDN